jgi:choline-sulfatase
LGSGHSLSRAFLVDQKALVPLRRPRAFLFLGLALAWAALASAQGPDVLLVTLDTTRPDFLGAYGKRDAQTPHLDALAGSGIRFSDAWSPSPLTLPAHASLFTGLEPGQHRVRDNGWGKLDPKLPVLAEIFQQQGWATAAFPASRVLDRRFGLDRGFDFYDQDFAAERVGIFGYPERPAAEVVDAALAWLKRAAGERPLFVWVHFYDPHAPYDGPDGAPGATPQTRYAGEIARVDRELGRLLAGWPSARRRITAVVADHGEAFGEHGETGHGLLLYRPTLQVPLIIVDSAKRGGKVIEGTVGTKRLAATLLKLAGSKIELPGPALDLEDKPAPALPIFHETLLPASAYGWSPLAAQTFGADRVIAAPRPEIYDLAQDVSEEKNLIAAPNSAQRRAQRSLAEHIRNYPLDIDLGQDLDPEIAAELRSLGYLSGQSRRAGTLDPKDGVLLIQEFDRTETQMAEGRFAEARAVLERLVAKSPKTVPFLSRLATVQAEMRDANAAVETLDRALKLNPQLDFLHVSRGEQLLALGRPEAAAQAFRIALDLNPRFATAWLRLAEIELRSGRPEAEKKVLEAGLAAGTSSAILHARLAEIALKSGDLASADRHLDAATRLLPAWPAPWRLWAEVARRQGQPERAAERQRRAGGG